MLRCVAGLCKPDSGAISYDGAALARLGPRQRARHLAFVEQMQHSETELRVRDIVALGRIPHRPRLGGLTEADRDITQAALEAVDMLPLAERSWRTMSGGEK
ncbi:MAG: ATP-binding cassette domain-containing protein, partial [Hyphomicrobiaceae bacterium]